MANQPMPHHYLKTFPELYIFFIALIAVSNNPFLFLIFYFLNLFHLFIIFPPLKYEPMRAQIGHHYNLINSNSY